MPVHLKSDGILKRYESGITNFEIPYGGWVFTEGLSNRQLLDAGSISSRESVSVTTSFFDKDNPNQIEDNCLKETVLIDMQHTTPEAIWKNINDKRKNMIRKAEKNNVSIKTSDNLDDFYGLLMSMNKRTTMHSKPREFYSDIEKSFGSEHSSILTAYLESKPIAALMITGNINAWHYWQGASDTNYNVGAGEMLQWQAMNHVFGKTWFYDMCVIEKQKLPNLAQFKQGFGGEIANYRFFNKSSLSYRILRRLKSRTTT
jgi:lipid II:glycine glycyltransferase (peptidoglycan interpeptide bridge formation enzyme)